MRTQATYGGENKRAIDRHSNNFPLPTQRILVPWQIQRKVAIFLFFQKRNTDLLGKTASSCKLVSKWLYLQGWPTPGANHCSLKAGVRISWFSYHLMCGMCLTGSEISPQFSTLLGRETSHHSFPLLSTKHPCIPRNPAQHIMASTGLWKHKQRHCSHTKQLI